MDIATIDWLYTPVITDQNLKTTPWILNYWNWNSTTRFLRVRTTTDKSNWRCKHCHQKILDKKQMQTDESHLPPYHIQCYMELYTLIMEKIQLHKEILERQMESISVE